MAADIDKYVDEPSTAIPLVQEIGIGFISFCKNILMNYLIAHAQYTNSSWQMTREKKIDTSLNR